MIDNVLRIGNFTSSQNYRACGVDKNGNPDSKFYTYVEEKMYERALKRSLGMGAYGKSMAWGKFLEKRVHASLGLEYELISKTTFQHKRFDFWTGSPDMRVLGVKPSEIKCYEPKKFASYVTALLTEDLEYIKKTHPAEYWQIISNAAILGYPKGEAVVYMPYVSELEEIREQAENPEYLKQIGMMPWEVRFIIESEPSHLALLPDDSKFKNLNIFEFDIPQDDVLFLTKRLIEAEKYLNNGKQNKS